MCESATGLEDGLTHSAAYGLRVNGMLLANKGVRNCCRGSTAIVENSCQDKVAMAHARMLQCWQSAVAQWKLGCTAGALQLGDRCTGTGSTFAICSFRLPAYVCQVMHA